MDVHTTISLRTPNRHCNKSTNRYGYATNVVMYSSLAMPWVISLRLKKLPQLQSTIPLVCQWTRHSTCAHWRCSPIQRWWSARRYCRLELYIVHILQQNTTYLEIFKSHQGFFLWTCFRCLCTELRWTNPLPQTGHICFRSAPSPAAPPPPSSAFTSPSPWSAAVGARATCMKLSICATGCVMAPIYNRLFCYECYNTQEITVPLHTLGRYQWRLGRSIQHPGTLVLHSTLKYYVSAL